MFNLNVNQNAKYNQTDCIIKPVLPIKSNAIKFTVGNENGIESSRQKIRSNKVEHVISHTPIQAVP